jgi:hypothetical protein
MSKKHAIDSFQLSILILINSFRRQLQPDDGYETNPSAGIVGVFVILTAIILNMLFQ